MLVLFRMTRAWLANRSMHPASYIHSRPLLHSRPLICNINLIPMVYRLNKMFWERGSYWYVRKDKGNQLLGARCAWQRARELGMTEPQLAWQLKWMAPCGARSVENTPKCPRGQEKMRIERVLIIKIFHCPCLYSSTMQAYKPTKRRKKNTMHEDDPDAAEFVT